MITDPHLSGSTAVVSPAIPFRRAAAPWLHAGLIWGFALVANLAAGEGFAFREVTPQSLGLWEGERPVLVYNHGVLSNAVAPADRARGTYVHPLYGLEGEVLTDDFPADHFHHRGLFWAWPHVVIDGRNHDLWMIQGIHQRFERWLDRSTPADAALLGVENGWYVGERKVMREEVRLRVHAATEKGRAIDCDFTWTPVERPVTLAGAEGKSYGGLTLRFAPRPHTVITTPHGQDTNDLPMIRLPWADLSATFAPAVKPSGAAIFIAPDHPDFAPMWLTRHYGVLCVGWPGTEPRTFAPGEPIRARYRVWVHRGEGTVPELTAAYADYRQSLRTTPAEAKSAASEPRPLPLRAELKADRVTVLAGDAVFTEYLFTDDAKYPYFFPVNGPRSGRSVTARAIEPYPHHTSLFFGCDRVNGGNYWQEGLDRGRIVARETRLTEAGGERVVIEQECRWERPGAEAPFTDRRRIVVSAPTPDRRQIDFDITLTALTGVKIEKSNHSLFAARLAPDLAVTGGGALMNAEGDQREAGTFGKPSPWIDARGSRDSASEGLALFAHPQNRWAPAPWFTRDYGFLSPTPLNWLEQGVDLPRGESLRLRYRVIVHADSPDRSALQTEYENYWLGE